MRSLAIKYLRLLAGLVTICVSVVAGPAMADRNDGGPAVVGYVESLHGGATVRNLDLGPITHVIDAFVLPDREGRLRPANGLPRRGLIDRCHDEGRLVLVSVGGGTVPGRVFTSIASNERRLDRFARAVVEFAREAGYDGLDIDWEFPEPSEREMYVRLIARVRQEMVDTGWQTADGGPAMLCFGVSTGYWLTGYDFAALAPLTDFAVYFGYDFRNPALGPWMHYDMMWPKEAPTSIEASVSGVVAEIARRGYPSTQLLVGLPFYSSLGRPWTLVRGTENLARTPLHPLYLEKKIGAEWINDPEAIAAKVAKALSPTVAAGRPVGGIAIWQLGHQGTYTELTDAISQKIVDEYSRSSAPLFPEVQP